jgi:hypothetical protein
MDEVRAVEVLLIAAFLHGFELEYAEYFVSFARASLDDSHCGRKRCFSNNLFRGGMTWQ